MAKRRATKDILQDILYAARKYDDKPHQLFSAIARAAIETEHADRAEIVKLMNYAYDYRGAVAP